MQAGGCLRVKGPQFIQQGLSAFLLGTGFQRRAQGGIDPLLGEGEIIQKSLQVQAGAAAQDRKAAAGVNASGGVGGILDIAGHAVAFLQRQEA